MTAIYSLPQSISTQYRFRSKPVDPHSIKAIIPTYNDWDGRRVTLDSLLAMKIPPKEIAVANDNKEPGYPDWLKSYPVQVLDYPGNVGPAAARNRGFGLVNEIPGITALAAMANAVAAGKGMPDYLRHGYCSALKYRQVGNEPDTFEWDSPTFSFAPSSAGVRMTSNGPWGV